MTLKRLRLALALAAIFCASTMAGASDCYTPAGSNQCYPTQILVNPSTGLPYAALGGGGGGGGGAAYGPTPEGTAPGQPPLYNGFKDAGGLTRGVSPTTQLPVQAYDVRGSGTIDATKTSGAGSFVDIPLNNAGTLGLTFTGLAASGATAAYLETNKVGATPAQTVSSLNAGTGQSFGTRTTDGDTRIAVGGHVTIRIQNTVVGTGSYTVDYNISAASSIVDLRSPLPPGTNSIGGVTEADGANQTLGSKNDVANAAPGNSLIALERQLHADLIAPTPAGTAIIGKVGTDPANNTVTETVGGNPVSNANPVPVAIQGSGSTGSVTAAGANGTQAQAVQGIAGGVPLPAMLQDGVANTMSASGAGAMTSATYADGAIPTKGLASADVQVTASGGTITAQRSADDVTWTTESKCVSGTNVGASSYVSSLTTVGTTMTCPLYSGYFRLSNSAGSSAAIVTGKITQPPGIGVFATLGAGSNLAPQYAAINTVSVGGGIATLGRLNASAATTNAALLKAGTSRVYKVFACNTATATRYIRLFNKAATPVPGTDTPFWSRPLPPPATGVPMLCQSFDASDIGYSLSAGIGYDITAAGPDLDATATAAGDVVQVEIAYQ